MEIFRNLILSASVVAIFSTVVLNIINQENSLYEILKISCGLLMIIVVLNTLNGDFSLEIGEFDDLYKEYSSVSDDALTTAYGIEQSIIQENIETYILQTVGIDCKISLDENNEITTAYIDDSTKKEEISSLLGISLDKIEYIESR